MDKKICTLRGMMSNFAQKSILRFKIKRGHNGKSVLGDVFFTPPFKIITPLEHKNLSEIMILCVSAGLMKGDEQEIVIHIGKDTKTLISSQSYEKIHNTQEGEAKKTIQISIEKNAFLDYSPLPLIPFANSSFQNNTNIFLQESSKLYYSEIFCAGRVGMGEIFAFNKFLSRLYIYMHNKLIFFENMNLVPSQMPLKSICAFGNYTHCLSYIIFDKMLNKEKLKAQVLSSKLNVGISFKNDITIIKALANESEILLNFKENLITH